MIAVFNKFDDGTFVVETERGTTIATFATEAVITDNLGAANRALWGEGFYLIGGYFRQDDKLAVKVERRRI